jgi:hypothetical protein
MGIIFGLKNGESLDLNLLVVMLVILVCFVLIIQSALRFVPFLKQGWMTWAAALVISLITSSTGAFIMITNFLFGFGNDVKFLQEWGLLNIILIMAILVGFVSGARKLLSVLEKKTKPESMKYIGRKSTGPELGD